MPKIPKVNTLSICHPIKLRYITKIVPLCPFVMRMESFSASVAVTFGLFASIKEVIEYDSALIIVGIKKVNIPTSDHR